MKSTKDIFICALCLSVALLFLAPVVSARQKVFTDHVTLVTSERDMANRVQVKDLAAFIKSAEAKAFPILENNKRAAKIMLQFTCQPNSHSVKLFSQDNPAQSILQDLYDAMVALPLLRTSGEVVFQIEIHVRP